MQLQSNGTRKKWQTEFLNWYRHFRWSCRGQTPMQMRDADAMINKCAGEKKKNRAISERNSKLGMYCSKIILWEDERCQSDLGQSLFLFEKRQQAKKAASFSFKV
jgi:hypothetical protein